MLNSMNKFVTIEELECADKCLEEALVKALTKLLPQLISADLGNTLVIGTDKKLKAT